MPAAVFRGAGAGRLEDVREPAIAAGEDVVIGVKARGIHGTDRQTLSVAPDDCAGRSGAGRE